MHLTQMIGLVLSLSLLSRPATSMIVDKSKLTMFKSQDKSDQKSLSIMEKIPENEINTLTSGYMFHRQFDNDFEDMSLQNIEDDDGLRYSPVAHGSKVGLKEYRKRDLHFEIKDSGLPEDQDSEDDAESEEANEMVDGASVLSNIFSKNKESGEVNTKDKKKPKGKTNSKEKGKSKGKDTKKKKNSSAKVNSSKLDSESLDGKDDHSNDYHMAHYEGDEEHYDSHGYYDGYDEEDDDDEHRFNVPVKGPIAMDEQFYGDPEHQPLVYEVDVDEVKQAVNDYVSQGKCKLASFLATAPSGKFFDLLEKIKRIKERKKHEEEEGDCDDEDHYHDGEHDDWAHDDYDEHHNDHDDYDDEHDDYDHRYDHKFEHNPKYNYKYGHRYEDDSACFRNFQELVSDTDSALKEYSMDEILSTGGEADLSAMSIDVNSDKFSLTPKEDKILTSKAERRINILKELIESDDNIDVDSLRAQDFQYRTGNIYLDEDKNELTSSAASLTSSLEDIVYLVAIAAICVILSFNIVCLI